MLPELRFRCVDILKFWARSPLPKESSRLVLKSWLWREYLHWTNWPKSMRGWQQWGTSLLIWGWHRQNCWRRWSSRSMFCQRCTLWSWCADKLKISSRKSRGNIGRIDRSRLGSRWRCSSCWLGWLETSIIRSWGSLCELCFYMMQNLTEQLIVGSREMRLLGGKMDSLSLRTLSKNKYD